MAACSCCGGSSAHRAHISTELRFLSHQLSVIPFKKPKLCRSSTAICSSLKSDRDHCFKWTDYKAGRLQLPFLKRLRLYYRGQQDERAQSDAQQKRGVSRPGTREGAGTGSTRRVSLQLLPEVFLPRLRGAFSGAPPPPSITREKKAVKYQRSSAGPGRMELPYREPA